MEYKSIGFICCSLFPSTVWGHSCITKFLVRCSDWVTKAQLSWPWCFGNLHHWCVFAFIVIELFRDLLMVFSKHRERELLREQFSCVPGEDLASMFTVWKQQLLDCIHSEYRPPVSWETMVTLTVALSQFFQWVLYGKWVVSPVFPCRQGLLLSSSSAALTLWLKPCTGYWGCCRVALVRRGGDCPMLSIACSSSFLVGWPQGTAEPCSHNGSAMWERAKCCTVSEERGEGVKSSPADTEVRRGEDVLGVQAEILPGGIHTGAHGKDCVVAGGHALKEPWSMENPCWNRLILKSCSPWEGATLQERKRMQRKERQRGAVMNPPQSPFPGLLRRRE